MEYYLAIKKNEILPFVATWMDLEGIMLSEISQTKIDKYCMISLICGEGNGNPLQCCCLENPRDGGAWWAAVYGVAQSWPQLKRLSSSSSITCMWNLKNTTNQ